MLNLKNLNLIKCFGIIFWTYDREHHSVCPMSYLALYYKGISRVLVLQTTFTVSNLQFQNKFIFLSLYVFLSLQKYWVKFQQLLFPPFFQSLSSKTSTSYYNFSNLYESLIKNEFYWSFYYKLALLLVYCQSNHFPHT